jgi:hypothetical protein
VGGPNGAISPRKLGSLALGSLLLVLFVVLGITEGFGHPSVPAGDVALVEDAPEGLGAISEGDFKPALKATAARAQVKPVPKPGEAQYEELKEAALGERGDMAGRVARRRLGDGAARGLWRLGLRLGEQRPDRGQGRHSRGRLRGEGSADSGGSKKAGAADNEAGRSGDSGAGADVATPLKVSGGGSEQFRSKSVKGNENSP